MPIAACLAAGIVASQENTMDFQLSDKTCLVTGASTGIGQATAIALAREGARVVVAARTATALVAVLVSIKAAGGQDPVVVTGDLAQAGGAAALVGQVLAAVGHVDVLVNNAGGSRRGTDSEAGWEEGFQLNFVAPRQLAEGLLPGMAERGWGRIVNVTGAIVAKQMNAAGAAKAALESWSKAAAAVNALKGVTVNCVAPGRIDSAQIRERLHPTDASRQAFIAQNIPAGRFGEAAEAAALITFLASGSAAYVNGTTIPVDGGALRYAF